MYVLNFIVLGDCKVGKTCFCCALNGVNFTNSYSPTLAFDLFNVNLNLEDDCYVDLNIRDFSGGEFFLEFVEVVY